MMVVAVVVISTVVDLNLLDVFEPRMLELARRTLTDHVLLMLIPIPLAPGLALFSSFRF